MPTLGGVDRSRWGWWVVAATLGAVLAFVIYSFIGTFVFGVFLYYATRPVYRRLKRYIRPPSVAAFVSLVVLALPALLLFAYTIAVGLQELQTFLNSPTVGLKQIEALLQPYFDITEAVRDPQALLGKPTVQAALVTAFTDILRYLGFLARALLHLFVMITIAFYLLRDDHRLASWFRRRFSDENGVVEAYTRAVDRDFSNIFFGNILNAFLTGVIGAVAYTLIDMASGGAIGLPYPALLGLLAGIASLIPVVGIKLVYVPVAAWLTFIAVQNPALLWFPVLFVAVSFVIVDVIPDLVLRPYVSGRGLHLGMVMLAYIFGPLLFGWYGLFLGPMLLVVIVQFVRVVLPELVAGEELTPGGHGGDRRTTEPDESSVPTGTPGTDAKERQSDPGDPDAAESRTFVGDAQSTENTAEDSDSDSANEIDGGPSDERDESEDITGEE